MDYMSDMERHRDYVNKLGEIIQKVFGNVEIDIIPGYDEDLFENENQQAFLDAGHFYGL